MTNCICENSHTLTLKKYTLGNFDNTISPIEATYDWKEFISPSIFNTPQTFPVSAWPEHIPFAYWLIESLKPEIFVELGTHAGLSYFTFCEAVQKANLSTKCFAIDVWTGDMHSGYYDSSVFDFVKSANKQYDSFSTLYKQSFDDAISNFTDLSIDLLHIDGFHAYEAAKHDFYNWFPKLSKRGIVLFHDTEVKDRGFGVYLLWEELKQQYPFFEFHHGHGLGILGVGENFPQKIGQLFCTSSLPAVKKNIQIAYERIGKLCSIEQEYNNSHLQNAFKDSEAASCEEKMPIGNAALLDSSIVNNFVNEYNQPILKETTMQVFWRKKDDSFTEENSTIKKIALTKEATNYTLEVNAEISTIQTIRIDPSNSQGIFFLSSIQITDSEEQVIADWESIKSTCIFSNLVLFKSSVNPQSYVLISFTNDPTIEIRLPEIQTDQESKSLLINITAFTANENIIEQESITADSYKI